LRTRAPTITADQDADNDPEGIKKMNAIRLLEKDHRKVESLFDRYRTASDGKREIVGDITRELSIHMVAEEKEFYPIIRKAIPEGESLVEEAVKEHQEAKGLLAELAKLDLGTFDMDAKVATLRRAIEHHVKDEEEEIFPKVAKALGTKRVDELGSRIERAKKTAPTRPERAAAAHSPGTSLTGTASAAADRLANYFSPQERKPARKSSLSSHTRSPRAGQSRAISAKSRSSKTKPSIAARSSKSVARKAKRR
jgi:hemerythrin superfamily protein